MAEWGERPRPSKPSAQTRRLAVQPIRAPLWPDCVVVLAVAGGGTTTVRVAHQRVDDTFPLRS